MCVLIDAIVKSLEDVVDLWQNGKDALDERAGELKRNKNTPHIFLSVWGGEGGGCTHALHGGSLTLRPSHPYGELIGKFRVHSTKNAIPQSLVYRDGKSKCVHPTRRKTTNGILIVLIGATDRTVHRLLFPGIPFSVGRFRKRKCGRNV